MADLESKGAIYEELFEHMRDGLYGHDFNLVCRACYQILAQPAVSRLHRSIANMTLFVFDKNMRTNANAATIVYDMESILAAEGTHGQRYLEFWGAVYEMLETLGHRIPGQAQPQGHAPSETYYEEESIEEDAQKSDSSS